MRYHCLWPLNGSQSLSRARNRFPASAWLIGLLAVTFALSAQDVTGTGPTTPSASNTQTRSTGQAANGDKYTAPSPPAHSPPIPTAGDPLYAPIAIKRQGFREKFTDYAIRTFGPRALVGPALGSAIEMANPPSAYPRDWRDGAGAFGKIYGSRLATGSSLQTGRFLTGALLHEDFRYRPSSSGNPFARSFHALAFTFIDKSDSGHSRIAFSNFVGAAAGGFVGELYLPRGYNDLSHAETQTARLFAGFAAQNLLREFAPEIRKVTRKLHVPFPRIPVPEWWTRRND